MTLLAFALLFCVLRFALLGWLLWLGWFDFDTACLRCLLCAQVGVMQAACERAAAEGISCEVIDLATGNNTGSTTKPKREQPSKHN